MAAIERFEDIKAWQMARELTNEIYATVKQAGFSRDYGLRDQITRASGSIMHNIAEGFDSGTSPEFIRFLSYAKRSCTEVQSELYVAIDQNYLTPDRFQSLYTLCGQIRAAIHGFMRYLRDNGR
jgi:four helix bundle protein